MRLDNILYQNYRLTLSYSFEDMHAISETGLVNDRICKKYSIAAGKLSK